VPRNDIKGPFLYMPMEIASRELDSRLLIALFAVAEGLEVVIGQKWLLQKNAGQMPAGYWIFKTLTPGDAKNMMRIQKLGHRISAIDEEMPGLGEGSGRLRWVDQRSVGACETIFCLGAKHLHAMETKFPEHRKKLFKTGNPRWDFLRPELRSLYAQDADLIRAKYGSFILVNTNIGLMNSAKSSADVLINSLTSDGRINLDVPEDRDFIENLKAFESANFAATIPLVKRLRAEFPKHNIVLRPHPTERIEPYEELLGTQERIFIVREGSAAAWLSACDVLVHTSCTTGAEAFALGKPSVCFQTIPSSLHTYFVSSSLSAVAKSEDEVVTVLLKVLAGKLNPADDKAKQKVFEKFFAGQRGALAAQRIAKLAAKLLGAVPVNGRAQWKAGWLFRQKWYPTKFQKRIFPIFSEAEITDRLRQLATVAGIEDVPHVSVCGDGQYHIYPKSLAKKKHRRRFLPF
jgi:surface carbohydrate biosynthesis protein